MLPKSCIDNENSLDAQPKVGLAFDAQIVALQPEGSSPETPRNRCGLLRWNTPHHPAIKVIVRWLCRGNRCPILPNPQMKALTARTRVAIRH
ncbi:hypothetical protein GFL39_25255 [Rhizobium leguminosarum bv. viciae]|nr:hypothetical protein [Rhizobium leguminosarum bv. viciae]NKL82920.1 hypothetical protein [Rhizobium leguminosarum bv. viciae]NKL93838.1 hypothetical protein [Rhizobium leguminosarum bv. viciae]NKM94027.1 hypothetical protein [Rhizobium leguminosarum bv. viciae]